MQEDAEYFHFKARRWRQAVLPMKTFNVDP